MARPVRLVRSGALGGAVAALAAVAGIGRAALAQGFEPVPVVAGKDPGKEPAKPSPGAEGARCAESAGLAVTVRDAKGEPVANALVTAKQVDDASVARVVPQTYRDVPLEATALPGSEARTDETGRAKLAGLSPGSSVLVVARRGRSEARATVVAPAAKGEALKVDLALAPREKPAEGRGAIVLTVRDGQGPIASAHVRGGLYRGEHYGVGVGLSFTADEDGTCVLQDLAPGQYSLTATQLGPPAFASCEVKSGEVATAELAFAPASGSAIVGTVVGPSGSLPNASVQLVPLGGASGLTTGAGGASASGSSGPNGARRVRVRQHFADGTDLSGQFRFGYDRGKVPAGTYTLAIGAAGFGVVTRSATVEEGKATVLQDTALGRGATVTGRVVGAKSAPRRGLLVILWQEGEAKRLTGWAVTADDGTFRIEGAPDGDSKLTIVDAQGGRSGWKPAHSHTTAELSLLGAVGMNMTVEKLSEILSADERGVKRVADRGLRVPASGVAAAGDLVVATSAITGKVIGHDGKPLASAEVSFKCQVDRMTFDLSDRTDAAGRFAFDVEPCEGALGAGNDTQVLYEDVRVALKKGEVRDLALRLKPGGSIAGTVKGISKEPGRGRHVIRARASSSDGAHAEDEEQAEPEPVFVMVSGRPMGVNVDMDGRFRVAGLRPGSYTVEAQQGDQRVTAKIVVEGGKESTADLTLGEKGSGEKGK